MSEVKHSKEWLEGYKAGHEEGQVAQLNDMITGRSDLAKESYKAGVLAERKRCAEIVRKTTMSVHENIATAIEKGADV